MLLPWSSTRRYCDPSCLLVGSLVRSFVDIWPFSALAGRQPLDSRRAVNITLALWAPGVCAPYAIFIVFLILLVMYLLIFLLISLFTDGCC